MKEKSQGVNKTLYIKLCPHDQTERLEKRASTLRGVHGDGSLVSHLVDGGREMTRVLVTVVDVTVVLGQQVDIVEDEAVEVVALQRLDDADVEETTPVELVVAVL